MKFICKQSVLNEAVNNVSRAVPVKSPVTALEGIKMYLNKNELELAEHSIIEMERDCGLDRNAAIASMRYDYI